MNRYAPVGVVINNKMNVLQLREETNFYLESQASTYSKWCEKTYSLLLRAAVYQVQRQDVLVRKDWYQLLQSLPRLIG